MIKTLVHRLVYIYLASLLRCYYGYMNDMMMKDEEIVGEP